MTFDAIGIAGTGLTVHRKWLDAVSDNLANVNTVTSTDGTAFQARYVVAQEGQGTTGVYVAGHRTRRRRRPPRPRSRTTRSPTRTATSATRTSTWHRRWAADHGPARLPGQRGSRGPGQGKLPGRPADRTPLMALASDRRRHPGSPAPDTSRRPGPRATTGGTGFATALTGAVDNLQQLQSTSNELAVQAVTGNLDDIHTAMIASTRAQVTPRTRRRGAEQGRRRLQRDHADAGLMVRQITSLAGRLGSTIRAFTVAQRTIALIGVAVLVLGIAAADHVGDHARRTPRCSPACRPPTPTPSSSSCAPTACRTS